MTNLKAKGNDDWYRAVLHNDVMVLKPVISNLCHNKRRAVGVIPINNPENNDVDGGDFEDLRPVNPSSPHIGRVILGSYEGIFKKKNETILF